MTTVKKVVKNIGWKTFRIITWGLFVALVALGFSFFLIGIFPNYAYYLYNASIIATGGLIMYAVQVPLHELGHYNAAKYYAQRKNKLIEFWLGFSNTNCSDWSIFDKIESRIILASGFLIRMFFVLITLLMFGSFWNETIRLICVYSIIIDFVVNILPLTKNADGYKLFKFEDLSNEEKKKKNDLWHKLTIKWGKACVPATVVVLFVLNIFYEPILNWIMR